MTGDTRTIDQEWDAILNELAAWSAGQVPVDVSVLLMWRDRLTTLRGRIQQEAQQHALPGPLIPPMTFGATAGTATPRETTPRQPDERVDGGPAFPRLDGGDLYRLEDPDATEEWGIVFESWDGMSLRDYFAGQVLLALLTRKDLAFQVEGNEEDLARSCYDLAEAMIAERRPG